MSSQTEANDQTGVHADELAQLSPEALKELYQEQVDQKNDSAAAALKAVIEEREKLQADLADTKSEKKAGKAKAPPKPRKGARAPKGRQIPASESFNQDPADLERLRKVLEGDPNHDPPIPPVIQADGTYRMTPWFIQLAISSYYGERRHEGVPVQAAPPIVPDPAGSAAAPPAEDPLADVGEQITTSESASAAPVDAEAEGAEVPDLHDLPAEHEPQAEAGPPNPYGDDGDDDAGQ